MSTLTTGVNSSRACRSLIRAFPVRASGAGGLLLVVFLATLPLQAVAQDSPISISVNLGASGQHSLLSEGKTAIFTVERKGDIFDISNALTVNYSINSGGGPANLAAEQAGEGDYTSNIPTSYEFPAGSSASHVFTVTAVDGDDYEPNEYFTVTATGSYKNDEVNTVEFSENVIVRIRENDERFLTLSPVSESTLVDHPEFVAREGGTGNDNQLTISLNAPLPYDLDIDYTVGDDPYTTASAKASTKDFTMSDGIAKIEDGDTSVMIDIGIIEDNRVEPTEYFTLDFKAPTHEDPGNALGTFNPVTFQDSKLPSQPLSVSIMDNDTASMGGIVYLRGEGPSGHSVIDKYPSTRRTLTEGQSTIITAEIAGAAPTVDIQIPLNFVHYPMGEATPADYSIPTSIPIKAGAKSGSVTLTITDDSDDERYRELLVVEIDDMDMTKFPTGYEKGDRYQYEVIMLDQNKTGTKLQGLSKMELSETSGNRTATFQIEMDRLPKKDTPAGAPFSGVTVAEGDPTFKLEYSGAAKKATRNDDYMSPIDVQGNNCSTTGGKLTCTVTFTVKDDKLYEGGSGTTEKVSIRLRGADWKERDGKDSVDGIKNTGPNLSLTIEDNDKQPMLSIGDVTANEGGKLAFEVTRAGAMENKLSVRAATAVDDQDGANHAANSDYETRARTLEFAKGNMKQTFEVTTTQDVIDEMDETFLVKLSNAKDTGGEPEPGIEDDTAIGTIKDNDDAPTELTITVDTDTSTDGDQATIAEAASETTVHVTAMITSPTRFATDQTVTVTVGNADNEGEASAREGEDYETVEVFTITIPATEVSGKGTFDLTPVDDKIDDDGEKISVEGELGDMTVTQAAITIVDDDTRGITVSKATLTIDEADNTSTMDDKENQGTYKVALTSQPEGGTVTINITNEDPLVATVATVDNLTFLTFDADNWEMAQEVTMIAKDDTIDDTNDQKTTTITHTVSANGTDYEDEEVGDVEVTVRDNDEAPTALTLTVDTDTSTDGDQGKISEGAGTPTVRITATLEGDSQFATDQAITITVGDSDKDTATEGTGGDYNTVAEFDITLLAGAESASRDLTLTLNDDTVDEPDETVTVTGELDGVTVNDTMFTIEDNDTTPTVTLVLTPASINESGATNASTVSATMDGTSSEAVTLTVSATPVNPAVASDLTLSDNKTLAIPANTKASTGVVTITAVDNDVDAADKAVTVAATATGGNALVQAPGNQTLTITDDDTRGITVSKATLTLDEEDNTATTDADEHEDTYTVVLDSEPSGGTVAIGVASGDTNIAGVAPATLTFTASNWDEAQTVTVSAVLDGIDNPNDRRTAAITHTVTATGTDYDGATASGVTVTVNDDDGPPTLSINSPSVTEVDMGATSTLTFTVQLLPQSGNTVAVDYADTGTGTATSNSTDYTTLADGTLTFDPGETSKVVAVTVSGDDIDEADETVVVRLSSPSNATLTGGATTLDGTGTITDNDPTPTVSVADATAVSEGNVAAPNPANNMTFTVTLSAVSGLDVTVPYTLSGTTTAGTDYTEPDPRSVTIAAGTMQADIVIPVAGDEVDEENETITVTLGTPTNATVSTVEGAGAASGTITDDDTRGVSVTPTALTVAEADDTNTATREDQETYKVVLTSQPTGAVTVNLKNDDESVARIDTASLLFGTGDWKSERTVTVTGQPDVIDNTGNERFTTIAHTVSAAGTDYASETAEGVTVTVTDDDAAPSGITLTANPDSVMENGGAKTITVTAAVNDATRYADAKTVTVSVGGGTAISGEDYTAVESFDITIGAGEDDASNTFTLTPENDVLAEGNETIDVTGTLSGITITPDEITLTDDDAAPTGITLSVDTNGSTAGTPSTVAEDAGATVVTVTATVNGETRYVEAKTVAVSVADGTAASPADYAAVNNFNITIAAGAASQSGSFTVTPVDDDLDESNETIDVTGTLTDITITGATVTLTDNDDPVSFSIADAEATEGGKVAFTVSRAGAEDNVASVKIATATDSGDDANAADADDYTAIATAQTLNFAKDITSQTVEVQTTQDDLFEPDETFKAVLSEPALGDGDPGTGVSIEEGKGTAIGTIKNDDTQPSFAVANASASEGDAITFTVTRSGAMDNAVSVKWNTKVDSSDGANAASATDYTPVTTATTLTFVKGVSSRTFTVATTEDVLAEGNETFLVELTGAVGGTITTAQATGTINDDDAAPSGITLTVSPATVGEGAGETEITVTATVNGSTRYVDAKTVVVSVADGTATSPVDYAAVNNFNITIAAGAASHTGNFTVTPVDDDLDESNETIDVTGTLSSVTITGATVTFTDNDDPVSFSIADAEATEGGKVAFTVSRAGAEDNVASVKIATATDSGDDANAADADDYTAIATAQTLNFAKDITSQTVEVQTTQDDLFEPDETFKAVLSEPALGDGDPGTGVSIEEGKGTAIGTIKNDDTQPSFAVANASASEGDAITFTVTRSGAMDNAVSVKWNTKVDSSDGANAASATDYTPVTTATTLTFVKGVSSRTFTVATTEDVLAEGNETFLVELTGAVGGTITTAQATGTINDDDAAPSGITLTVSPATVGEGAGETEITVTATVNGSTRYVDAKTVVVSVADGTATSPVDYAAVNNFNITIAAGAASHTGNFTVTPVDDDLDESNETIDVTGTLSSVTITGATVTFTDNDDPVSFSIADAEATEGGKVAFTVSRAGAEDNVASVKIATATDSGDDANAADADDYTAIATAQTLNFAKDITSQTVEVQTTQDDLFEPDETFKAVLSEPALGDGDPGTGVSIEEGKGTAIGTIKNDDTQPSFAVANASASEGDAITFTVTRSGAMDNAVSVKWNTKVDSSDGANAASATDYTPVTTATTLTFVKGVSSRTFTVATTEDVLAEGNETFLVELTGAVGGTITTAQATGTINDDDAAPSGITLTVSPATVGEGAGETEITVTATVNGSTRYVDAKTVVVSVADGTATSPVDYAAVNNFNITIAAGAASHTGNFTVTPVDDDLDESNETIDVTGTLSSVTITGATVTFTDNDDPVSFSIADAEATEGGKVAFTVSRAGAEDNVASVKIATATDSGDDANAADADDYTAIATAQTLNFAKDITSQTVEVQTTQDDLFEPDETFKAVLSDPALGDGDPGTGVSIEEGKGTATGTIKNDDTEPSFAVADASAAEGDAITFTVTRSGAMDNAVSVKWNTKVDSSDGANAASATDYTPVTTATTLTFVKGVSSRTFTVATTEDVLAEGNETFLVELTGAVDGTITTAQATGTINDDDAAPSGITLTVSPATVGEGAGETEITVTATVNGSTRYVDAKTVVVSVADGTATSPADYAAVNNFNITIAAGAASHTGNFTVTPVDDDLDESNETIDVTGTLSSVTITGATVTFTDNDDPVSFSIADAEATEGGKVAFTVSRAGAEDNVASVKIATATDSGDDANAADADDYTAIATAQTLNFAKDITSQTVEVQTTQDDLFEPDETFKAVLSDPALGENDPGTGVTIESGKGTAIGTIKNDDTEPSFAVADASAAEGDAITFTVTRSGAMDNAVSVKWNTKADTEDGAAEATDYTPVTTATTLTFVKGVSSRTFTVATTEDVLAEGNETFLVELTGAVGGTITTAQATGTINDDDAAPGAITISVDTDTSAVGTQTTIAENGGAKTVRVTATITDATRFVEAKTVTLEVGVTADSATESTDYTEVPTKSITINAGAASGYVDFTLTPTDDTLYEGSETISLDGTLAGVTVTDATITLTDDDGAPTALTLSVDADTGTSNVQTSLTENGGAKTVRVTATLGGSSTFTEAKTVTLEVGADTDSATEGADYTEVETKSFTINAGASSGYVEFTLTPTDDTRHETSETISLDGTLDDVTVTDASLLLTDNDAAPTTLTLAVDADNATENVQTSLAENGGAKTVKVTATLGGSTQFDVDKTVTLIVGDDDDSATEGTDYTTVDNITLTIPAGDQDVEHTFTLTPTNDAFREGTETISFDATLTGVTVSGASITLTSDDAAPAITLTVDADKDTDNVQTSLAEDGGVKTVRVTATLDGTTRLEEAADLTLAVGKDGDSAEEGTDYTTVADRTISIGAGVASVTHDFTLTPTNDNLYEGTETISLDGTLTGVAVTNTSLTLTDDDAQPSFAVADASALEGDAITFTVTRTGAMDNAVSVKWNTKTDTGAGAASTSDYTEMTTATKLDFAKGEGTQTFTVATTEDVLHEGAETFLVELTEPVGAIISDAQATGTITDDDAAPTGITLSVDTNGSTAGTPSTVAEDAGATVVTVTATVNGTTRYVDTKTVAVSVADGTAASPADYAAVNNFNITIAAGAASHNGSFTVTPVDDDLDEVDETIDVTGTLSSVTITGATVTFTDNDDPVSFSIADAEATEGGKITFTVSRAGAEDNVASVKVATATDSGDGVKAADTDDYTAIATTQTLNFAKGVTSQTVEVQTTQDDLFEPDETFRAVLSDPALGENDPGTGVTIEVGKGTAIGTIKNDDAQPSFAVADASALEGDAITFTVTRSGAMDNVVSVKWNTKAASGDGAASATDYTEMTTATKLDFAKGVGTQTFTVATTEDVLHEGAETFLVELTEPTGAIISDAEATGTITDDDAASSGITLTVSPNTVGEGAGETEITVTATVNGTTRYPDAHTVTISVGGGTATSDTDYDAVANFDITIAAGDASKAGTFDLTPTDDDLHEGSETIDITGTSGALSITKAEITLTDNDGQPSFAVADASAAEGDAITFTVTRTGAMDNAVSVKWNTKADTSDGANAASATDYTPATTATKLDFAKGVGTQTFTVATTEDTLNEGNETFLIELTEPVGGTITTAEATGTITNDDAAPTTLTLAVDADNATENVQTSLAENGGAKTVKVTATLGGSTQFDVDKTVTLIVGDDDDSATEGTDYTTVDNITLTIPAGDQDVEHTFTLTPTNDAFREGTETISFDATLTGVTVSGASITLTSDDAAPAITLTVDADKDTDNVQTSLAEDGGVKTVRVTATLDGTTRLEEAADLTLAVGKDGDSAEEGTDYTTVADRTISIGAGVASVTHDFTLTPTNDNLYEGTETISLDGTLTGVAVTNTSLTLTDDDAQPSFAVADASALEGDAITFTVTRSGAMDNVVSVKWNTKAASGDGAASATDYTEMTTATKLDFAKGVGTQTFTVATTEDVLHEGAETFLVELTEPTGAIISDAEATGTITDDDAASSGITLTVSPNTVGEGAGETEITVTATVNGTTRYPDAHTVTISVGGGTATSDTDYDAVANFDITIAAGDASKAGTFDLTPTDDDLHEGSETIDITGTSGALSITKAEITLTDNDGQPSFAVADASAAEGDAITFTVTRTGAMDNAVSVKWNTKADTSDGANAASATDYTPATTATKLDFAKGVGTQTFTVATTEDTLNEGNETFLIELTEPVGGTITTAEATGTITNDDAAPTTLTLAVDADNATENVQTSLAENGGAKTVKVTATLGGSTQFDVDKTVTLIVGDDDDSATEGTDYTTVDNITLTIPAGDQDVEHTFTLTPTNDAFREGTETISFDATLTGVTVSGASITLTSDDAAPAITLTVDADKDTDNVQTSLAEDGGVKTVRVTATLDGTTRLEEAADLTLAVGKDGDSAEEGTDYTTVADRTISIGAGVASVTHDFTLTPTNDNLYEGTETISLDGTLTGVAVTNTSLTLTDDDAQPSFAVADASALEGDAITFTVTRSGAMDNVVSVKWNTKADTSDGANAASGTDYTAMPTATKLDFAKGVGTQTFTVATTEDVLHEGAETFLVELTEPTGAIISDAEATGTITDDDAASSGITLTVSPNTVGEGAGETEITVTATVNGTTRYADAKTVTISVGGGTAISGTDYTTVDDITLTIPAGDQDVEHTFTLTPTDDDLHEGSETIDITGTSGALSITKAEITLTDNDGQPSFAVADASAAEGDAITFTVTRTGAMDNAVSVKWNTKADTGDGAASTSDYTAMTTATKLDFAKGVGTQTFTVATTEDVLHEGAETFLVELTEPTGAIISDAEATGTITNDDAAPSGITLTVSPNTVGEEDGKTEITVTATVNGTTRYVDAKTVTISVGGGTAISGTDYEAVVNFDIIIAAGGSSKAGTFYLTPTEDFLDEINETINVTGASGSLTITPATVTITDATEPPTATLVLTPTTINESGATNSSTVTATLSGESSAAVTLTVDAVAGANTAASDFTVSTNKTLTIAAGATTSTGTVTITAVDNNVDAPDKSVTVSATTSGGGVSNPTDQTLTIKDDEGTPTVTLVLTPTAIDESGDDNASTVTATLSSESSAAVTVTVSVPNDAPVTLSNNKTLTIAAGATTSTGTVTITAVDNEVDAPDKTVTVSATASGGSVADPADQTLSINDDEGVPTATLVLTPGTINETGATNSSTVTATLSGKSSAAVTLMVAAVAGANTAASDFTVSANKTLTIAAGATTSTGAVTITAVDNNVDAPDKSVTVSATTSGGGVSDPTDQTLTITDDEATPTVTLVLTPATINESGATNASTVTATLSGKSSAAVTVEVSVPNTAPVTLSSNTILSIAAGAKTSTGTVTITAVDNNVDAPNETVTVSAAAIGGVAIPVIETLTINDDDVAPTGITLTVSPATIRETDGETEITVTATVNGTTRYADAKTVTVSVGDGTATSGMDYDAVSNFDIIIAAGDTSNTGTFDLTIINDAVQEKDETIEITGSSGALNVTKAMITITNSDPMPAAWLGRFGRTVAEQALDGIAGRIAASRSAGVQGSIAGHALNFDSPYSGSEALPRLDPRAGAGGTGVESSTTNDTTTLNNLVNNNVQERSELTLTSGDSGIDAFDTDGQTSRSYTMTARELLLGSSFTATGEKDVSGGSLASWGRTAQSSFDGREGTLSLDGEATTTMLGVDYARDHWLVGMALMQSNGKGGYQDSETELRAASPACSTTENGTEQGTCNRAVRDGEGEVEATLTAVTPYAAIQTSENLKLWGTLGHGTGEVTLTPAVGDPLKADISWTMAAVGLRSDIIVPRKNSTELGPLSDSGLALALTADALWARTSSNRTQDMVASDSDVTRLRFGLEGSYQITLKQGGSVAPRLEVGVRQDGGSAETGLGIELVGGLSWLDPTLGLSIDLSGRTLIVHSSDDLKNQSFAVAFAWDPDPATQRGPSLKFSQQWGTIALGGLDTPFGPDSIEDLGDSENTARWQADAAWGFPIFGGSFTGSPHVGVGLASDTRDYSLGWRLTPAANANAPDLSFAVKATRQESDTAPPEHSIGFVLIFRW